MLGEGYTVGYNEDKTQIELQLDNDSPFLEFRSLEELLVFVNDLVSNATHVFTDANDLERLDDLEELLNEGWN